MDGSGVRALVFDLDGTLLDSDEALVAPFLDLGVAPAEITFGHAIAEECGRLGIAMEAYVEAYDTTAAAPFPGVAELVAGLGRWAVCSNKHPRSGLAELDRLGWVPEVALFADSFGWRHKSLDPVLAALGLAPDEVVMVGDSDGDRRCAEAVGCRFVWAGWNPRVRALRPCGDVAADPVELLGLLA